MKTNQILLGLLVASVIAVIAILIYFNATKCTPLTTHYPNGYSIQMCAGK